MMRRGTDPSKLKHLPKPGVDSQEEELLQANAMQRSFSSVPVPFFSSSSSSSNAKVVSPPSTRPLSLVTTVATPSTPSTPSLPSVSSSSSSPATSTLLKSPSVPMRDKPDENESSPSSEEQVLADNYHHRNNVV